MADAEAKPAPEAGGASTSAGGGPPAATTTISTISLQSGDTRLVIALLQSKDVLQLKVLELTPEITLLGSNLAEALALQRQHEEVLQQLQSKQSPVEELLRQADQLIATQRPRAEVYAAMAESLGIAWKDVNSHLDLRKTILELNVAYHSRAEKCTERMLLLATACRETELPVDFDAVRNALTRLHVLRRTMLEDLMVTLQDGKALLEKLKEVGEKGSLDSRPGHLSISVSHTISQVEHWLEELHDRRQSLDLEWQNRKTQLEQCCALALSAKSLKEIEETLNARKEVLHRINDHLGDSASSAELLLHEHKKLVPEAKDFQDRCLKITRAAEVMMVCGHFAGKQATTQAYIVLNSCAEYINSVEQREVLLNQAIAFFRSAQSALTKLDQLEIQLTTSDAFLPNLSLAQLHVQTVKSLEDITAAPLQEGYSLLESVGSSSPGVEGVKRAVNEIEDRKTKLLSLCTAHEEENLHISKELTTFLETHNILQTWLVSIAEAFLQGHQDMGSVLAMAEDFLLLHQQLLSDLQTKGAEINEVLLTLPPILERLNDAQRLDIDGKVESLHSHWLNLKTLLEARIDLASLYVKFHTMAVELANEFDSIDMELKKGTNTMGEEAIRGVEQNWLHLQHLYGHLCNLGQSFIEEGSKCTDPYLDVKRASLSVQTLLEHFGSRQLVISESWQTWQMSIITEREFKVLWERNITESKRTLDVVSNLDVKLYPVLTGESTTSKILVKELEEKLQSILPELKKAQTEIELRVKTAENLINKGDAQEQKESLVEELMEKHHRLNTMTTEYQILVQMFISFLTNLSELEKTIENLQSQYNVTRLPNASKDVELLMKEHEASKQAVLELFKFTQSESEQIIQRINQQEPEKAARHDIQRVTRLLEIKKMAWESAWTDRKLLLEQRYQLCQFDYGLEEINSSLSELSNQLLSLTNQIRDAEGNPRTTQCAYQNFEKTIQILETKIETFVTTTHHLYQTDQSAEHVDKELKQLKEKWLAFRNQAAESRRLIDLSTKYFKLVDEANVWYLECGRLFISVARRSTKITSPEEALILQSEVDDFLKIGRIQQEERVKEITNYALDLYGEEWSKRKIFGGSDYTELVDALATVSEELGSLAANLRIAREEFERRQKEMQETDATLAAAKAEAAAAKAAATAAEEARKAAEAASKALQQASLTINEVELVHIVSTASEIKAESEQLRKTPSPPCKKVKVTDNELPQSVAPVFTVPLKDATIQEGEQFTFECRVTGFPIPEVVWYKDSISIQNNPDYQTTYQEGNCTLAIEETFTEDSAQFTCKAFNSAGTAETNAILSVKEAQPEEQLAAPTFSKRIESGSAKEGSTFHLKCIVEGNPLPTVQWYKNGTCIDNSPDYVITYNNGEAILKFEEVFLEDQAEYTCKACNPLGTDTCSARLTVDPLEPTEVPRFITPLSNVMARAGRKIKLECVVTGLPLPELLWSHNGKIARETRDLKLQFENGKGTLIINEAFPKDAGTYVVIAKNIAGEATCSCNVSVKGRLPTETSDSEIPSDFEPVKPSIQLALKDVTVIEGKQVQLDCIIVGQPEPEVIWYHNDRPVKESSDFQLLFQGDRCSLVIHEAYLEDTGEYKVVAINSGGEASSKCSLIVQSLGEAEPATRSQTGGVVELPLGTPPKFNSLLSEPTAQEGEKVVLECNVTGDPKPVVQWFFNDQEVVDEEKRKCYEDGEGNIRLTLHPATLEDRGVYTVKASNEFGEAKSIGILIVKPSTVEEPKAPIPMEEKLIAPSFKELFADKIVHENEDARFECVVYGKPTPKVHWMFNNEPILGEDFLASSNGERQVLTIKKVQKIHCGNILCVAENDVGKASCAARLNLMEPIKTPDVSYSCATSATEKTESTSFVMKQTVLIKSSSETSSMMLEGLEPKLQNHTVSSHSEQILLENGKKPATKSGGEDTDSTSCYSTPFSSPRPARKSVPPRFVSPLNGKIVDQGADVILEGIIDGYPQPTVTWTKNSQELLPGGKVSIKNDRNRVEVIINDVTVKDSGKYTCKAVNSVGSASSTADVVVRKTIFPPVFGRRLHAQTVKEGDRVVMEVEITGTPDPTVTWYKEGQKIVGSVPGQLFRTKEQGNSYSLIIEKATLEDSGQYSVKAVNAGGEAQCTADFIVVKLQPEIEIHRQEIHEDLIISTLEKLSRPHTPVTSAPAVSAPLSVTVNMKTPSPTLSLLDQNPSILGSSYTSESRIFTETTKTEKLMSIKLERTPSPVNVSLGTAQELSIELPIPVQIHTKKVFSSSPTQPETVPPEKQDVLSQDNISENKSEEIEVSKDFKQEEKKQEVPSREIQIPIQIEKIEDSKQPISEQIPVVLEEPKFVSAAIHTQGNDSIQPTDNIDQVVDSGVETKSVSKKEAFEFFVNKLKETEDDALKHIKEQTKLPTKETKQTFVVTSLPQKEEQTFSKTEVHTIPSNVSQASSISETVTSQFHSEHSSSMKFVKQIIHQHQASNASSEEFNLQPEPPPEMGFIPKSEISPKVREDVSARVKKLEESNRVLSPTDIPSGAVRIFPAPLCTSPLVHEQVKVTSVSLTPLTDISTQEGKDVKKQDVNEVLFEKSENFKTSENFSFLSTKPSAESPAVPLEINQLNEVPSFKPLLSSVPYLSREKESVHEVKSSPNLPLLTEETIRVKEVIKEEANFEQFPSLPFSEQVSTIPPTSTLPVSTVYIEQAISSDCKTEYESKPPIPDSQEILMEDQSLPCASVSETHNYSLYPSIEQYPSIEKSVSSSQSTEIFPTEKQVTPQKSSEPEFLIPRPSSTQFERAVSPKPSVQGIAMDKIWAHKHPDSGLRKVWPPPQNMEEKPIIPWTSKNAPEKVWTPTDITPTKITTEEVHQKTTALEVMKPEGISISQSSVTAHKEETSTLTEVKSSVDKLAYEKQLFSHLPAETQQNVSYPTFVNIQPPPLLPKQILSPSPVLNPTLEAKYSSPPVPPPPPPFVDTKPYLVLPVSEDQMPPIPVPHYIAQASVTHSSAILESEISSTEIMSTITHSEQKLESNESSSTTFYSTTTVRERSPPVVEEHNVKPSEAKKTFQSIQKETLETKPTIVPDVSTGFNNHISVPATNIPNIESVLSEPVLKPGSPPEIGFAHPPLERRQSYVETIEQDLEKDLKKEPSRHLVGAVRTIPPPPPVKDQTISCVLSGDQQVTKVSPLPSKKESNKSKVVVPSKPFERFPDLEPFPFKPDSPKEKPTPCPPPPKPSKFVRGDFTGSDYESDLESSHIPPKWRPYESDTEDLTYRRVKPPLYTHPKRPKSTEPAPLPPSHFEKPLLLQGPPRPVVEKIQPSNKEVKSPVLQSKTVVQTKSLHQSKADKMKKLTVSSSSKKHCPPLLKPGSPPEFVETIPTRITVQKSDDVKTEISASLSKSKPDSPKSKQKSSKSYFPESGYMADTDEPRHFKNTTHKSVNIKHDEIKSTIEKTTIITEKMSHESKQSTTQVITQTGPKTEAQAVKQSLPETQHQHHETDTSMEKTTSMKNQSMKVHHKYSENKQEKKEITTTGSIKSKKEMVSTVSPKLSKGASAHEESSSLSYQTHQTQPEPVRKRTVCPPPPSPSKFVKGNFQESDHESDYDCRIPVKWKPTDSDADEPSYRPVRPVLTPKHHLQTCPTGGRTPTPPTEFDHPPEFGGPPRPKFEPIEKPSSTFKEDKRTVQSRKLFKPKPVTPRTVPPMEVIVATPAIKPKENITLTPGSPPEIGYAAPPRTKVKVSSFENATQIETSNVMNFAESTEHSHRVVNVQQTTRVIKFADKESKTSDRNNRNVHKKSELQESRGKFPPPTRPKKFVPGEFRESDYESDIESVRIKPKWTPGNSDTDEPHYRKVKPPQVIHPDKFSESNTLSQVQSISIHQAGQKRLQRVEEMRNKFDGIETVDSREPPVSSLSQLPKSEDFKLQPGEPPEFVYSGTKISKDASYVASKHMKEMTNSFKSKAQQFVSDIMTDVSSTKPVVTPEKPKPKVIGSVDKKDGKVEDDPQAYREESRVAEYGTKHIDPDTGLIYFKYDFGYEFGIVLPGEAGKQVGGGTKKPQITPKRTDDIEVPVIHEKTASEGEDRGHKTIMAENVSGPKKIPQFRPKKFTHFKSVKWEPASESEMSEAEGDVSHKKYYSLPQPSSAAQKEPHIHIPTSRWEPASPSPLSLSLSPSLPSLSPHTGATIDSLASPGGSWQGLSPNKSPRVGHGRGTTPTPPSSPSTPGSTPGPSIRPLRKPPMFITPLRDIAVVKGQTARFECIVQAEPMPNILWARDGRILENSDKHQIHFRNGVCRLTIPQAFHDDAGNYTCTATNMLGTIGTTGSLQVPGERCSLYK